MKNNPYIGPRPSSAAIDRIFSGAIGMRAIWSRLSWPRAKCCSTLTSGAGKTSLLNAQVIPTLEDEGFFVLPVTRVGSSLPPGLTDKAVPNIFVLSALIGLASADVPFKDLLRHTLLSFLREYHLKQRKTGILIFFEFRLHLLYSYGMLRSSDVGVKV